jgi:Protein of unknown function (DUF4242)
MKTFMIERSIPGAGSMSEQELAGIAKASVDAMNELGRPYEWVHTYVGGDKFVCVHRAENAEDVKEHARLGGFPCNGITEVANTFDASWAARAAAA